LKVEVQLKEKKQIIFIEINFPMPTKKMRKMTNPVEQLRPGYIKSDRDVT